MQHREFMRGGWDRLQIAKALRLARCEMRATGLADCRSLKQRGAFRYWYGVAATYLWNAGLGMQRNNRPWSAPHSDARDMELIGDIIIKW